MAAVVALIGAVLCYSAGNLFQAWAAEWAERRTGLDPGLLARLFADPLFVIGFGFQVAGFVLVFFASAQLPLYLVQSGLAASVAVTVVIGVLLLRWRIKLNEAIALFAMIVGLFLIGASAVPSVAAEASLGFALTMLGVVAVIAVLAAPASRVRSAIPLGVLAGIGFSVVAVLARPLAAGPLLELPLHAAFWVLVIAAVVSQTLFAMSLQRGTASAVAATQAATAIPAGIAGIVLLGDQIATERHLLVFVGLALVVGGIVAWATVAGNTTRRRPREILDGSASLGRTS